MSSKQPGGEGDKTNRHLLDIVIHVPRPVVADP